MAENRGETEGFICQVPGAPGGDPPWWLEQQKWVPSGSGAGVHPRPWGEPGPGLPTPEAASNLAVPKLCLHLHMPPPCACLQTSPFIGTALHWMRAPNSRTTSC